MQTYVDSTLKTSCSNVVHHQKRADSGDISGALEFLFIGNPQPEKDGFDYGSSFQSEANPRDATSLGVSRDQLEGILPTAESSFSFSPISSSLLESIDLGFSLPGNGDAYSYCGEVRFRGCFQRENHVNSTLSGLNPFKKDVLQFYIASCGRLECPVCYEKACGKLAIKMDWRISHFKLKGRVLKPIHVMASAPSFSYGLGFKELKAQAIEMLKSAGMIAHSLIFHPWRLRCIRCSTGMEKSDRNLKVCPSCFSSLSSWVFSPHFHGIGFGWIKNTDHIFEKHGWVIKNLGVRKSVTATALYQLSHAGFSKKLHTVVWCGLLAYNQFKCPKLKKKEYLCPICGEKMVSARIVDPERFDRMRSTFLNARDGDIFFVDPGVFGEDSSNFRDPGGGSSNVGRKSYAEMVKSYRGSSFTYKDLKKMHVVFRKTSSLLVR